MAFNNIPSFTTTAASNTDISGVSVAEGWPAANINNSIRALTAQLKTECALLGAVASATATDITAAGAYAVSGNTTITSFTVIAGSERTLIFSGAPLLTHNATSLICPGAQNIQLAAGDVVKVLAHDTNQVTVVEVQRANGISILANSSATSGYALTSQGPGASPAWTALTQVGGGYATKTADYTVIAADNGDIINWTTANFTANLTAAATLGAGFTVTLMNTASTNNVTIDPNSAETIDGQATRVLEPGNRVTLICTGAAWITQTGTYTKTSTATAMSTAQVATAHGFPRIPTFVYGYAVCTSTDGTYAVGDRIQPSYGSDVNATGAVSADATNFYINGFTRLIYGTKGGGIGSFELDETKWNVQAVAMDQY